VSNSIAVIIFLKKTMRFSLSWLKQHLNTTASAEVISETLTRIGLEVEEVIDNSKTYEPFVIAQILDAKQHPNADKLRVCEVTDGSKTMQIICGAPNARAGIKVVLAPVGTLIPNGGFTIKAAKIRDVESNGMMCSFEELSLPGDSAGIIELPEDAPVGSNFAEYYGLNDVVFDISLTPNRGDAACVYGIARDLHTAGLGELIAPNAKPVTPANSGAEIIIEDKEGCYEFTGTIIRGIDNTKESSKLIRDCLASAGSKPKSALVDISNYAMLSCGRPNHMYDLDKISGRITIRKSHDGEKFIALGGEEYTLPDGLLVVADQSKILAIAGVMGGELSKVDENTKNVLLEVANFDPISVAKAGRTLNLLSDSRYRFERRVDSSNTKDFIGYISTLITDTVGGKLDQATHVLGNLPDYTKSVPFNPDSVSQIAGTATPHEESYAILERLGFKQDGKNIVVPSYRFGDINMERDLVEEVLRIYGLDRIANKPLPLEFTVLSKQIPRYEDLISEHFTSIGYTEVMTMAFTSRENANMFGFKNAPELANPISQEMVIMRGSMIPELCLGAKNNVAYGLHDLMYFEVGNIYSNALENKQEHCLTALRIGKSQRKNSFKEERNFDFYDLKSDIFAAIKLYGFDPSKLKVTRGAPDYYHPGKSAALSLGKNVIGYVGEIHPKVLKTFDLDDATCAFELFIDRLPAQKAKTAKPKLELSYLQSVDRDFAFVLPKETEVGSIMQSIRAQAPDVTESVNVFDVYAGDKIEAGKKSVALSVTLRPKSETFKDTEIEAICQKIISVIQKEYNGTLR
jgi:phenylalanyl-tRNA synthetase beta chain